MMKKVTQLQTQDIIEYKIHILKVRQIFFYNWLVHQTKTVVPLFVKDVRKKKRKNDSGFNLCKKITVVRLFVKDRMTKKFKQWFHCLEKIQKKLNSGSTVCKRSKIN